MLSVHACSIVRLAAGSQWRTFASLTAQQNAGTHSVTAILFMPGQLLNALQLIFDMCSWHPEARRFLVAVCI